MLNIEIAQEYSVNPVDVFEHIADINDWMFDRIGNDEITISARGNWSEYQITLSWIEELEVLHIACAFDLHVATEKRTQILSLISLINEQLWIGHFEHWTQDEVGMFRHSLMLNGGAEVKTEQCESLMNAAIDTCNRYFQAFHFVVWAGKTPKEALECVLFETIGEA